MNSIKKYIVFMVLITLISNLVIPTFALGVTTTYTYYVSLKGSDTNAGNIDSPFATLAQASKIAKPGDTVFIRGGIYRTKSSINISVSGTEQNRISFKAYPNETPIFDMSVQSTNWVLYKNNIFKTSLMENVLPVVDDSILKNVDSVDKMTENTFFKVNSDLYVWCKGGGIPSSHDVGLIKNFVNYSEPNCFTITGNYLDFCGITVRNCPGIGIYCMGSFVKFIDCTTKFCMLNGIHVSNSDSTEVSGSSVNNNVLQNWPRGTSRQWAMGLSFMSGKNCKAYDNRVFNNNGEGIGTYGEAANYLHGATNLKITDNVVFDNWSVNIWLDHATNPYVNSNVIYDTPKVTSFNENPLDNAPNGILCAEETDYGYPGDLTEGIIINNLIINCSVGFGFWNSKTGSGLKNFLIANNTITSNVDHCSMIRIENGNHFGANFVNNIINSTSPSLDAILLAFPETNLINFNNNSFFCKNNKNVFATYTSDGSVSKSCNFVDFVIEYNIGTGSIWASPSFVSDGGFEPANYSLSPNSPCIDSGKPEMDVSYDFSKKVRFEGNGYDIGALESSYTNPLTLNEKSTPPANYIKNGSFETGIEQDWQKIANSSTSSTFCKDSIDSFDGQASFNANIVNGGTSITDIQFLQYGLNLKQGECYILSFKGKGDRQQTISLELGLTVSPYSNLGLYKSFTLNQNWEEYRIMFTSLTNTDSKSAFSFKLGKNAGIIKLDDIKITPFSQPFYSDCILNPQVPVSINPSPELTPSPKPTPTSTPKPTPTSTSTPEPSQFLTNLISDGGVEGKLGTNWKVEKASITSVNFILDKSTFVEGKQSINVRISKGGTSEGNIQLKQNNITLLKNKSYTLSFKAKADSSKSITCELGLDIAPYSNLGLYKTFTLGQTWSTYTTVFTPTSNTDKNSKFTFLLGMNSGNIWIDDVKITQMN